MKFGKLIEYNLIITLREKSYIKCVGEAIHRPFFKKLKLSISFD